MSEATSPDPSIGRPWISCCMALSADGKISSATRRPCGWTSRRDHQRLLDLRVGPQAIIAGRVTVVTDHMTMTAPGAPLPPLRCVVSRHQALPDDHPIFSRQGGDIHCLFTSEIPTNAPTGATHHAMSLEAFIRWLHVVKEVNHLHCEGGGELIRSLAELDWLDELHLTFAAHTLFGGASAPTLTGSPMDFLPHSRSFKLVHFCPDPEQGECYTTWHRHPATNPLTPRPVCPQPPKTVIT